MIEKKEFYYENENVLIKRPNAKEQDELFVEYEENRQKDNSGVQGVLIFARKVVTPKNEAYDFANISLEQFNEMLDEPHLYVGFEEIINVINMLYADITTKVLQRKAIALREEKAKYALKMVTDEVEEIKKLVTEVEKQARAEEVIRRVREMRKERQLFLKEVPQISEEERMKVIEEVLNDK